MTFVNIKVKKQNIIWENKLQIIITETIVEMFKKLKSLTLVCIANTMLIKWYHITFFKCLSL